MSLVVKDINKVYPGDVCANQSISFQLNNNECLGIVGPNGSGKTTLVRQILKVLKPTSGIITIDGKDDYLDNVSYVPQISVLYAELTTAENIDMAMRFQGIEKNERKRKIEKILELTTLDSIKDKMAYTLSGGQRKLVGLACALAIEKKYIILDEPTSMVDIVTKECIWNIISECKKKSAILLASHDMDEVKRISDKLLILKEGKVLFYGNSSKVGNGLCVCKIDVENPEVAIELGTKMDINVTVDTNTDKHVTAVSTTDKNLFSYINKLAEKTTILSENIEYPAFYEGVMQYVK